MNAYEQLIRAAELAEQAGYKILLSPDGCTALTRKRYRDPALVNPAAHQYRHPLEIIRELEPDPTPQPISEAIVRGQAADLGLVVAQLQDSERWYVGGYDGSFRTLEELSGFLRGVENSRSR